LDKNFLSQAKEKNDISGTTALTVLFRGNKLYVANSGDSRAVLCRNDKAYPLSVDHKPNREEERIRVEKAGGWIETSEALNIPRLYRLHLEESDVVEETEELVGWVEVHRGFFHLEKDLNENSEWMFRNDSSHRRYLGI
jgi:serine/threonine protein phosphatase PrpC